VLAIPLALCGMYWGGTAHWIKRLVDLIVATILSQLVITMFMVLAAVMTKDFKVIKPRGNGAVRWEGPLGTVGLDTPEGRPIPPAMDQALAELCILRDVLSHRGGRVDQKAADDWPCGTLEVGSFVRVSQNQVRRYSAAVGAFGAEICRRLLARFSVPVNVNLDNWEQHDFLI
jgi:hypothetical protein